MSLEERYWKASYEAKAKEFSELQASYREFQQSSQEFENELEVEVQQKEEELARTLSKLAKTETQLRNVRDEYERNKKQADEDIADLHAQLTGKGAPTKTVDESRFVKLQQAKEASEKRSREEIEDLKEQVETQAEQLEILQAEIEDLVEEHQEETTVLKGTIRDLRQQLATAAAAAGTEPDASDASKDGGGRGSARNNDDAGSQKSAGGGKQSRYVKELIEQHTEQLEELTMAMEILTQEKVQLETRLLEESELNEELTEEVSQLTDDFMDNSEKIERLERELRETRKELDEAQSNSEPFPGLNRSASGGKLHNIPEDRPATDFSEELRAAQDEIEVLVASNKRLTEDVERFELQLRAEKQLAQELQAELETMSSANVKSAKKVAAAETLAKELEDKALTLEETEGKASQLEEELFDANTKLSEAQAIIEDLQDSLDVAKRTMKDQANSGAANMQQIVRERDELTGRVDELEEHNGVLEREMSQAVADCEQAQAELAQERQRVASLMAGRARAATEVSESLAAAISSGKGGKSGLAVKESLSGLRTSMAALSQELLDATQDIDGFFDQLRSGTTRLSRMLSSAQDNYNKEVTQRRQLFDNLQDIKGNIRVFCRVRPLLEDEIEQQMENVLEFPGANQIAMIRRELGASRNENQKIFNFDRVFGPGASQVEVFRDVQNLVVSVLDGYNVCIFAYGQTGSGKTYTMEGPSGERGVSFRSLGAIFSRIKALAPQYTFTVHVSLLEIYNEKLRDLLDPESKNIAGDEESNHLDDSSSGHSGGKKKKTPLKKRAAKKGNDDADSSDAGGGAKRGERLHIRQGTNGVYVSNATRYIVRNPQEVMEVLAKGAMNRAVGTTSANEHSSRSHSLLIVEVDGMDQVTQNRTHGRLYLVDLAGSERNKHSESAGQRFVEATYINKSLSALGDVMTALSNRESSGSPNKKQHIPYRNSKLTYLLQDSLGGSSKTMMFVNVSPADRSAQETMCSLQFARRVRKVRLTATASVENATLHKYKQQLLDLSNEIKLLDVKLRRNKEKSEDRVRKRDEQIYELKEQLKVTTTVTSHSEMEHRRKVQELEAELQSALRSNTGDAKRTEAALQRKILHLEDKVSQVEKLLKHSQRENKALKDERKQNEAQLQDKVQSSTSTTRSLEVKVDKLSRKVRAEEVARKRAEEAADSNKRATAKELEDREQIIRLLREKNRKLRADVQHMKKKIKKSSLTPMYTRGAEPRTTRRSATRDSLTSIASQDPEAMRNLEDSKDQIRQRLELEAQSEWHSSLQSSSGLAIPRKWRYLETLRELEQIVGPKPRSAPHSRSPSVVGARYRATARAVLDRRSKSRTREEEWKY